MEKYSACDMADVAIILSSLFTSGSWGSTARSRDSASSLLDLRNQKQKVNHQILCRVKKALVSEGPEKGVNQAGRSAGWCLICHLVLMLKPLVLALSTSWLKNSWRGGGCLLSRA